MPLIILSGLPSSGKTHRARQIVEDFEQRARRDVLTTTSTDTSSTSLNPPRFRIHHISDHSLHLPRSVYSTARAEKDARAALYSAVKRALGRDDIVVLDSGNYIKGWRYQLHCEAKALGTPSCVVHIGTSKDEAHALNAERLRREEAVVGGEAEGDPYDESVWEELVMRFEEPNGMARWDSPLFTVVREDVEPPCEKIWEALVGAKGGDGRARVVRPHQATVLTPAAPTNHLYDLDRTTQLILSHIQAHLTDHPDEPGGVVTIPLSSILSNSTTTEKEKEEEQLTLTLPVTTLTLPQLQRLRRQFIAMHRSQSGGMGVIVGGDAGRDVGKGGRKMGEREKLARGFVGWLRDAFGG